MMGCVTIGFIRHYWLEIMPFDVKAEDLCVKPNAGSNADDYLHSDRFWGDGEAGVVLRIDHPHC